MSLAAVRTVLIVAASASALSRSAARGGWRVVAIDGFGDEDTEQNTIALCRVPYGASGFDTGALEAAIDGSPPTDAVIYGGGVDTSPVVLERLFRTRKVFGNDPATVRSLKDPACFFRLLRDCDIPFPEVRFDPPPQAEGWLLKSGCSEGGAGVRFATNPFVGNELGPQCGPRRDEFQGGDEHQFAGSERGPHGGPRRGESQGWDEQSRLPGRETYFQRYLPGNAMSALFLADGKEAGILGFNTLWTESFEPSRPFRFAGAINRAGLDTAQRETVHRFVNRITRAAGLRGLNSLDFLLDGARMPRVLEVNPRPSATMSLYEDDFPTGLVHLHVRACEGRLPEQYPRSRRVRAFRILYAADEVEITESMDWPTWCRDRPRPGQRIERRQPLCSIVAEGVDEATVHALIEARSQAVARRLPAALRWAQAGVQPSASSPSRTCL
ncbi:MAG TPA: ATP-grasp domain-containing protein [Methylococcus sp.]|nr:ATP-grasp domain-containing protein [Methylococcus sp.]